MDPRRGLTLRAPCWRVSIRHHFHGPDPSRAHIHAGAKVSRDVPGLGGPEPVAFGFVDDVIEAPGGFVGFVFHVFA